MGMRRDHDGLDPPRPGRIGHRVEGIDDHADLALDDHADLALDDHADLALDDHADLALDDHADLALDRQDDPLDPGEVPRGSSRPGRGGAPEGRLDRGGVGPENPDFVLALLDLDDHADLII